ncbi:hypothetical protein [Maribacter luteus]|mgnify:CR=1|nr:hypothetical protein [Maribacter luteus]
MELFQQIVVYIIVALAIVYMVGKFLWPKSLFSSKKSPKKVCGEDGCGCH